MKNNDVIYSAFCRELKVQNSTTKNSKSCNATIDNDKLQGKNAKDLADKILEKWASILNKKAVVEFTDAIKTIDGYSDDKFTQFAKAEITKAIISFNVKKIDKMVEIQKNTHTDAYNTEKTKAKIKPTTSFNDIDGILLRNIVFCKEDQNLYYSNNNSTTLIGTINDITKNEEISSKLAMKILSNAESFYMNPKFDFRNFLWEQAEKITHERIDLIAGIRQNLQLDENPGDLEIEHFITKKLMKLRDFLEIKLTDESGIDWESLLSTTLTKIYLNQLVPASIFNDSIAIINEEFNVKEIEIDGKRIKSKEFSRYCIDQGLLTRSLNIDSYVFNIFKNNRTEFMKIVKTIDKVPRVISDKLETSAEFYLTKDIESVLPNNFQTYDECKILKAFRAWQTDEQFMFTMAWAYQALHPLETKEQIGLLLHTGGGTFKTGYYAWMIEYLVNKIYPNPNNDLFTTIGGDNFNEPTYRDPSGKRGVSRSAIIFNDECTTQCLETYKNFSGSIDGVAYSIKKLYSQPSNTVIHGKFLFATNKNLSLKANDGSYLRRLAIIKNTKANNTERPYNEADFLTNRPLEAKVFYEVAKGCYEKIKKEFGGLYSASQNIYTISRALSDAWNEEDNLYVYNDLLTWCAKNDVKEKTKNGKECFIIYADVLKQQVAAIYTENALDVKYINSFFTWMVDTDKTESQCVKVQRLRAGKDSNAPQKVGYFLYNLKKEVREDMIVRNNELKK